MTPPQADGVLKIIMKHNRKKTLSGDQEGLNQQPYRRCLIFLLEINQTGLALNQLRDDYGRR